MSLIIRTAPPSPPTTTIIVVIITITVTIIIIKYFYQKIIIVNIAKFFCPKEHIRKKNFITGSRKTKSGIFHE